MESIHEMLSKIESFAKEAREKQDIEKGYEASKRIGEELDSRVNFRVNSGLKEEFEKVCKQNHTTLSRELKRYMSEIVRIQRIL